MTQPSVAIITSTIGRAELEQTILSVQNQSYSCKHYVFVDGEIFWHKAKAILDKYPNVIPIYLPMNTGKNLMLNSSINAIAPFLVSEDIICYLDDDNRITKNHVETIVDELNTGADFVYSLRSFYLSDGAFICRDDFQSLGNWRPRGSVQLSINLGEHQKTLEYDLDILGHHIDTNCYALPKNIALMVAQSWYSGLENDRVVYKKLKDLGLKGQTTGKYTVHYVVDFDKFINVRALFPELPLSDQYNNELSSEILKILCQKNIEMYGNERPWAKE